MKTFLLFLFLLVINCNANATHLLGGEIYYDHIGGNQYKVTFVLFRNCNSASQFDNLLHYTIFQGNNSFDTVYTTSSASRTITSLPIDYSNPCVVPPPGLCVDQAVYIDTITLLPNTIGYYLSYQRCCWATNIINIIDPGDYGLTLTCIIPGTLSLPIGNNSSARFNNLPPLVLCSQNELDFDHSATDPDGDSVRIFLCEVDRMALAVSGTNPSPEPPGPYLPTTWETGFSAPMPFGSASPLNLDSITGQLIFTPVTLGNFLTGVCLEEYRNGILINRKNRTFNFTVVNCDQIIPFNITEMNTSPNVNGNSSALVEDCGVQFFYFSRLDDSDTLEIEILQTGTATNGADYAALPSIYILAPGTVADTISIYPYYDGLVEGSENVQFTFRYYDICSDSYDSLVFTIEIIDYVNMSISNPLDSLNICPDTPENAVLSTLVQNGIQPISFYWHSDPTEYYPDQTEITVGPNFITEFINPYSVEATDACGKKVFSDTILVYNQCPIIVPNVVTTNTDGINDVFIIQNIKDYQAVHLKIFNRWGELIYESTDYQNDWTVRHRNGIPLIDGVYFYTAEVINDRKYVYDDQEETKYQAQGFFHVVRD